MVPPCPLLCGSNAHLHRLLLVPYVQGPLPYQGPRRCAVAWPGVVTLPLRTHPTGPALGIG